MNNEEPAFPVHPDAHNRCDGEYNVLKGMSLRDYFAAKAMEAFTPEYFKFNGACFSEEHIFRNLPAHAYKMADAMLAERNKQP